MNEKRRNMMLSPNYSVGRDQRCLLNYESGPPHVLFSLFADTPPKKAIHDAAGAENNNNNNNTGGSDAWRSLADNFIIEFVASLFVHISLALFWNANDELRFAPAATLGLVLLCLKDEDLFFPDASPTVTFLLYALGGYNWPHLCARLMGQLSALGLSIWFCSVAVLPPLAFRVYQPMEVVFFTEALASTFEHLTVIYMVLPLLPLAARPTAAAEGLHILFYRARSKRDSTESPPMANVVNAALVIAVLHYVLQRGLCAEVCA